MVGERKKQMKYGTKIIIFGVAVFILALALGYFSELKKKSSDIPRRPLVENQTVKAKVKKKSKNEVTTDITFHVIRVREDDVLNIRRLPDPRSEIIGTIPLDGKGIYYLGERVAVLGKSRYFDWYRIRFNNITGWVNSYFLEAD